MMSSHAPRDSPRFLRGLLHHRRAVHRPRRRLSRAGADAIGRWRTPRARLPPRSPRPASAPTTRSSSGRRIAPNGWSRSGAACSRASCSCPSTIARRPICSRASLTSSRRRSCSSATRLTARREVAAPVWKLAEIICRRQAQAPAARSCPERSRAPGRSLGRQARTLAEIIFTSGATADPKGVTITHRNVLANIIPIEREIAKYRSYERPFHPIRFLNLLPLSHMFGQSMATFVPPMLAGTVVFSHGYSPVEIVRQIKSRRVSVLVCVPKVLDVLREHVAARACRSPPSPIRSRASTFSGAGGATARCIACSAGSSGASSAARRRSIRSSKRSGASSDFSSCRATASPRRRPSSRSTIRSARRRARSARRSAASK